MKPGDGRDTARTAADPMRELLVGQVEACFRPTGEIDLTYLRGTLGVAAGEGLDARALYQEALEHLPAHRRENAPDFESLTV